MSPGQGSDAPHNADQGRVGGVAVVRFPLLLAGIDPVQEARLVALDGTLVSGRYLREREAAYFADDAGIRRRYVPAIAASRTYLVEDLEVTVERLRIPSGTDVPAILGSRAAYGFLSKLEGRAIATRTISADGVYETMLRSQLGTFNIWEPGEARYGEVAGGLLRPSVVRNASSIWSSPYFGNGFFPAPPANRDVQFRRLRTYVGSNTIGAQGVLRTAWLKVVGRYDPERLPGFSALSDVPLETYYPPELEPADAASRRALGGEPLLPTQNLGDYVQQPPLLLTTLEGIEPYVNPVFFKGSRRKQKAPISVIRVRVAGVTGPDELSMARIRAVALAIRDETGLDVDITAGSSPKPLRVALARGEFGRPPLLLREGWVKKGVSVAFLRAADRKSLALTALVLVICGFFVSNGAFATVRARRREIGTLLCLGWPQRSIFSAVLGEIVALGAVAGAVGVVVAVAVILASPLETALWRSMLVLPVAVFIALGAGVTLRTFGWTDGHLQRLVALEGLGLGLAGGLAGSLVGFAVGAAVLAVPVAPLAFAALAALAGGVLVGFAASLVPLARVARLTPPAVLAEE